jgi:tetratricopeptide (TPR) repeat protein
VRPKTILLVGGATAAALALGGLVGGVLAESGGSASPTAAPVALTDRALTGAAAGIGASATRTLEARLRAEPEDSDALTELGYAYQLRWRETADASYLPRSEEALRRAVRFGTEDANAVVGLGSLALIRHEFRAALAYGRRAQRMLPGSYRPYGIVGDALVELGRYDEAFAAFDRMVSLRPGLASYARVAYARELTGDRRGARAAMRLALVSAAGQPEPTAWAHVELAKLELALGRVDVARRHALAALRALPGYPTARIELARADAAAGNLRAAIVAARLATEATPTAQAVTLLGDLLERAGRHAEARRQRATVAVIDRLLAAGGVQVELESAVYRADNRIRPFETVALARRARAARPSIYGDDAVAWALARAGRCADALPFAERALRLGTQDGLLLFHRGYAAGCAGDRAVMLQSFAEALDANPAFSVRWAPVAQAALQR